jgi:CRP-like cAMP-binding protein
MTTPSGAEAANRLVAALPSSARRRWLPLLRRVDLRRGQALEEPGRVPSCAWFPITAVASLHHGSNGTGDAALVGREGLVGTTIFMGGGPASAAAIVQCAGSALRLPAAVLGEACDADPFLHGLMLRYAQALMAQVARTATCNRCHALDRQLCRVLLQCLDRTGGSSLAMTHERLARLLGVRRSGVTEGALALQRRGVIRYARGLIDVLDRSALEAGACACYAAVEDDYARLLGTEACAQTPKAAASR